MPLGLASASHHAKSIINGTTAFTRSRQLKHVQYKISVHVTLFAIALASHDADSIINGTIEFIMSKHLN